MKGKIRTTFTKRNWGEQMNKCDIERIENQFAGFCYRLIINESNNIYKENQRKLKWEKSLEDLTMNELSQLSSMDTYFLGDQTFEVEVFDGSKIKVVIMDSDLFEILNRLPKDKFDIILLSYFLKKSDREIAENVNVVQSTLNRRRNKILAFLRELWSKEHDL